MGTYTKALELLRKRINLNEVTPDGREWWITSVDFETPKKSDLPNVGRDMTVVSDIRRDFRHWAKSIGGINGEEAIYFADDEPYSTIVYACQAKPD